jgi:Acetyltransferase (GNAT) family
MQANLYTFTAFFTFLRANLVLPPTYSHSAMSSYNSTPLLTPNTSQILPSPSPSPLSTSEPLTKTPDLSSIPPLTTNVLTDPEDRILALKLVADSVAQQRQAASRAVIFHPIFAAIWVLLNALVFQWLYKDRSDLGIVICTAGGMTMAMLVGVRMVTGPYLSEAETITWSWLSNPETGDEDLLIGSKFGEDVIGALVLRLERPGGAGGKRKGKVVKIGGKGKGIIRAWTTGLKYRHKGIGTALLEEAVRVTREKCGKEAEVGFASDHANSKMVLPNIFNGMFRRREQEAIKLLSSVVDEGNKRR